MNFQYESPYNQNWKITSKTDTLLGHKIQSAELEFEGRNWEAWFSSEIPVHAGPYKFSGLPGLILKVSSMDGEYSFQAQSIEKKSFEFLLPKSNMPDFQRKR